MGKAKKLKFSLVFTVKNLKLYHQIAIIEHYPSGNLSLVHIFADEVTGFPMSVKFYRMIPMIDGCSMERCARATEKHVSIVYGCPR